MCLNMNTRVKQQNSFPQVLRNCFQGITTLPLLPLISHDFVLIHSNLPNSYQPHPWRSKQSTKKPRSETNRNAPFCEKQHPSLPEVKKLSFKKPFPRRFRALPIWPIFYPLEPSSHFNYFPPFSPMKATATLFLATSPLPSWVSVDCPVFL